MPILSKTAIQFSEREIQILDLAAKGLTNHQIAGKLFLCESTVECYRRKMAKRTGTKYILPPAMQTVNGLPISIDNPEPATTEKNNEDNMLKSKKPSYLKVIRGGLFPVSSNGYISVGNNQHAVTR